MKVEYRKMRNGKEFMKIFDRKEALSILFSLYGSARICVTDNSKMIEDYFDPLISNESNVDEFNEHYLIISMRLLRIQSL